VLFINGHERDFMMAVSAANFEAINHVPVFYGARHGAGHAATVDVWRYRRGGRRWRVACSYAYASVMRPASSHARPKNVIPAGNVLLRV
jgi:hypothetical protein